MSTKQSFTYVTRSLETYDNGVLLTKASERVKLERIRVGVSLPGWSEKIRSKEVNATTPLDASEGTLQEYKPGSFSVTQPNGRVYKLVGLNCLGFDVPKFSGADNAPLIVLRSKAEAAALGKAYSKIQGILNPFGASVMLGELKETIGFLRDPLGQTVRMAETFSDAFLKYRKAIEHIKKRGLDGPALTRESIKLAREYSKSLLELRFGVIPLVHDSIAILELAKNLAERNSVLSFRCYGEAENVNVISSDLNLQYYQACKKEVTTSLKAQVVINFGVKEAIDGDGSVYDYTLRSLKDLSNVPEVLWELTYASWLIDYFVNVSDIITSITTSTKSVIWQSKSVILTKNVKTHLHTFVGRYGGRIDNSTNQITSFSYRTVKRTTSALTIPSVTFRVPGYQQLQNTAAFAVLKLT